MKFVTRDTNNKALVFANGDIGSEESREFTHLEP
jgi:hypothetical protein